jgi:hypothetical protein
MRPLLFIPNYTLLFQRVKRPNNPLNIAFERPMIAVDFFARQILTFKGFQR